MSSVYVEEVEEVDFYHILNNFEELVGEPLLVYNECEEALEKYIGRELSEYEKDSLRDVVEYIQERMFYVRQEMAEMDDNMYEEWYNWRADCNYHSYDSYPVNEQIKIWEDFKRYYDTIMLDSESEMEEEDYDY